MRASNLQTIQTRGGGDLIDFSVGHPSLSLLPLEIMRRACRHRLEQDNPALLQYGYEQGSGSFRKSLAEFLALAWGVPVDPDCLFVTNGVSQALDLLCTLHTRPGDLIFVEEPTYFLALRIFKDHGLRVASLPMDEQGLVVEALEERLARERPVFLYTVPTHQNPSGATLPPERRNRLVKLSEKYGFLILADEAYHLLSYFREPPPSFATFASVGTVFSLGSFSKILAPGLRLGWVHARGDRLQPLVKSGMLDSGGGLNPFVSALVQSVLERGLQDAHLKNLRAVYGERLKVVCSTLSRELPGLIRFVEPWGGFFVWVRLPDGVDAGDLLLKARSHKVGFMPGTRFSSHGGMGNFMRLSFSYYDCEILREGVRSLAEVLRKEIGRQA